MSDDGLRPVAYKELRRKLGDLGFTDDPETWECPDNCRTFRKDMMAIGTPYYYTVIYKGEDHPVPPPTIRKLLATLGVNVSGFLEA